MNIRVLLALVLMLFLALIGFGNSKADTLTTLSATPTPIPTFSVGYLAITTDNAKLIAQLTVLNCTTTYNLSWSSDGVKLALASSTGLWVYNMDSLQSPLHLSDLHTSDVSFSPTQNLLASVNGSGELQLWDMSTGTLQTVPKGLNLHLHSIQFNPDGIHLASSNWEDNSIRLWDISTGESPVVFQGHTDVPLSMRFSPDGKTLTTIADGWDHTIRLWDTSTGESLAIQSISTIDIPHDRLWGAALNLNDSLAALGTWAGEIRLWNISTGEELGKLEGHTAPVRSLAFNPTGTLLASGDDTGKIRFWDVSTGEELGKLEGHTAPVRSLAFNPTGTLLASAGEDNTVRLWGIPSQE